MDSEEKRETLSRALVIDKEIQRLKDHLSDLENGAIESIDYGDKVQTSPAKGSAADTAVELLDEIQRKEKERDIESKWINQKLEKQTHLKPKERKILYLRFVDCMNLEDLPLKMAYSYSHSKRILKEAINFTIL